MARLAGWIVVIGTVVSLPAVPQALSEESLPQRTITVAGEAAVAVEPDQAEVMVGVVSQAQAATNALEENNKAVAALIETLRGMGVAERDLQTRNFDISPVYERQERGQPTAKLAGYRARNMLSVTVRDLGSLGKLLDAVVRGGANRVNGIRFTNRDMGPTTDQARREAIADAKRKAALYAEAAGVRAGRVLAISEQSVSIPQPRFMQAAEMARASAVPIAPGENEIRATITVTFALE